MSKLKYPFKPTVLLEKKQFQQLKKPV